MKVAFIINPFSANREYEGFLKELKSKMRKPNYIISQSIDDTHNFIDDNLENYDVFVAVGGDGTISTVAQKLINTNKILAIFPMGSGNGFANEAKFSKNIDELLEKLKQKKSTEIDTFTINDKLSINVSGVGFDGEIAKRFEATNRGFSSYITTTIQAFTDFDPIQINFEGKYKEYDGEYMMLNIANTRQFGNNAYIAPQASTTDGLVDIVLVKKFPIVYVMPFVFKMFSKTLQEDEYIKFLSVPEIEFTTDCTTWHIDGEHIEIKSPIKIKVNPKSLKILD